MSHLFWDRWAWLYEGFMKKDAAAYEELYALLRPVVKGKTVLELATGTGLIARNIAAHAVSVVATDFSPKMVAQAEKIFYPDNVTFARADMFHLPYEDRSFEVVIVANALHIVPEPAKALLEIRRVLKDDGILIAPTFTHKGMGLGAAIRSRLLRLFGFPLSHAWSPESYCDFLKENGWKIAQKKVLQASFPMTYVACRRG